MWGCNLYKGLAFGAWVMNNLFHLGLTRRFMGVDFYKHCLDMLVFVVIVCKTNNFFGYVENAVMFVRCPTHPPWGCLIRSTHLIWAYHIPKVVQQCWNVIPFFDTTRVAPQIWVAWHIDCRGGPWNVPKPYKAMRWGPLIWRVAKGPHSTSWRLKCGGCPERNLICLLEAARRQHHSFNCFKLLSCMI